MLTWDDVLVLGKHIKALPCLQLHTRESRCFGWTVTYEASSSFEPPWFMSALSACGDVKRRPSSLFRVFQHPLLATFNLWCVGGTHYLKGYLCCLALVS